MFGLGMPGMPGFGADAVEGRNPMHSMLMGAMESIIYNLQRITADRRAQAIQNYNNLRRSQTQLSPSAAHIVKKSSSNMESNKLISNSNLLLDEINLMNE